MQQPVRATQRRRLAVAGVLALLAGAGLVAWLLVSQPAVVAGGAAESPAVDQAALPPVDHAALRAGDLTALPAGAAGMRVAIQPETGDFEMPSPEQMQALGLGASAKSRGDLVLRTRADGGLTVDVRGHFLSYSVAHRNADGSLRHACVTESQLHDHCCGESVPGVPAAAPRPAPSPATKVGEVE
jgi:hypothetical protein